MTAPIRTIAIIGLGLIGGSLADLLHEHDPDLVLLGVDTDARTRELAKAAWFSGVYTHLSELPQSVDLVWICTPLELIRETVEALSAHLQGPAILTDVGSLKGRIGSPLLSRDNHVFIPGHPMAGTEKTGFEASAAVILSGAKYLLCPPTPASPQYDRFAKFLTELGFRVKELSVQAHDEAVALASHFPYIMACLTVSSADAQAGIPYAQVVSSGFRDTTRVASASPRWGTEVCLGNRDALQKALATTVNQIEEFSHWLASADAAAIERFLSHCRKTRNEVMDQ